MNTLYFDWSIRRGITIVGDDSDEVTYMRDLDELFDSLTTPHRIIGEATFSSFDIERRIAIIKRAEAEGHELLTTPTRLTGRKRRSMGYTDLDKSDEIDVLVIRQLVRDGVHLKAPSLPNEEFVLMRKQANAELMRLRRTGELTQRPRAKGFKFSSAKDAYATSLLALLPAYDSLSPEYRAALGDGTRYSLVTLAAAGVASKHARNRREFERLAGLYAHGYPSQIRADLMHWSWAGGGRRARLNGSKEGGIRKRDDLTLSQYRQALRWLYSRLRVQGTPRPEAGTVAP